MKRLLSIDWDFFFPNPYAGARDGDFQLYDWGHSETNPLMSSPFIWHTRAAGFLGCNLPLPRCVGFEDFWSRVKFNKGAKIHIAESHVQAASLGRRRKFNQVVNFDAHHDQGYGEKGREDACEGSFDCANWALYYLIIGGSVETVFPAWQENWADNRPENPLYPDKLTYRQDAGESIDEPFDAVFVCRSGSWTPTWCDEDFHTFIKNSNLPLVDIHTKLGGNPLTPRPFDIEAVKERAEQTAKFMAEFRDRQTTKEDV